MGQILLTQADAILEKVICLYKGLQSLIVLLVFAVAVSVFWQCCAGDWTFPFLSQKLLFSNRWLDSTGLLLELTAVALTTIIFKPACLLLCVLIRSWPVGQLLDVAACLHSYQTVVEMVHLPHYLPICLILNNVCYCWEPEAIQDRKNIYPV